MVTNQPRRNPDCSPKFPILFSEEEGKISRANRGRDPLHLFAALGRQLGYPEVPRPRRPDAPTRPRPASPCSNGAPCCSRTGS
ncbi:MAG: hypothetical protein JO329_07180, partial [Planctomycetaceae bacterium]|nr:hypothetical protein [Planctomycetaceae bacterium]